MTTPIPVNVTHVANALDHPDRHLSEKLSEMNKIRQGRGEQWTSVTLELYPKKKIFILRTLIFLCDSRDFQKTNYYLKLNFVI